MRDHRKLKAFELADTLVLETYKATSRFPRHELFGLTAQMRRSAVSVAANIVGGCARPTQRDYMHFLSISLGSLRELGYHIHLASRLGYFEPDPAKRLEFLYEEAARVLAGLVQSLQPRARVGRG